MPDRARERAPDEDVLYGLAGLIAENASRVVGQAVLGQALASPTSIQKSQPDEFFCTERCPCLPSKSCRV